MNTCSLVLILTLEILKHLSSTDVSHTATWKITFLDCCAGCIQCILNTVFLLLHLHLGSCTYIEDSDTAGEFAETLLKFLLVIIRGRCSNLLPDKFNTLSDIILVACTAYDSGVLLGDGNLLSLTEHLRSGILKSEASFL